MLLHKVTFILEDVYNIFIQLFSKMNSWGTHLCAPIFIPVGGPCQVNFSWKFFLQRPFLYIRTLFRSVIRDLRWKVPIWLTLFYIASSVDQLLWMAIDLWPSIFHIIKWLQLRPAMIVSAPAQLTDSNQSEHWPTCNTPTRSTCSIATHKSCHQDIHPNRHIALNSVETRVWVSGILVPTLWHSCHDGPAGTALSRW